MVKKKREDKRTRQDPEDLGQILRNKVAPIVLFLSWLEEEEKYKHDRKLMELVRISNKGAEDICKIANKLQDTYLNKKDKDKLR